MATQDPDGDVRLIQLADVGDDEYRDRSARFLTSAKAAELGCTYLKPGDILVARMPEPLGRACVFPGDQKPSVTAVDICIVRPSPGGILPSWLLHAINAPQFRAAMEEHERGTTRKRISRANLGRLRLPVPPLPEQGRIVTRIEALKADVTTACDHLRKVATIVRLFRQSVLSAACSGRLTERWRKDRAGEKPATEEPSEARFDIPPEWSWQSLDELREGDRPIIYGIIKPGPHVPGGVPYVRVVEMKNGSIDVHSLKRAAPERAALFRRATLRAGDILISKDGTVGRVAVVPEELEGGNITQHLVRFSPNRSNVPAYLVYALQAPVTQKWLVGEKKGVALQGVNVEDFRRLPIPIPPLDEQHEIVRRIKDLFALADTIEVSVGAASSRAAKLTQSILAKAFRGELVPTEAELARKEGRDYEPASILLERIRGMKAQSNGELPEAAGLARRMSRATAGRVGRPPRRGAGPAQRRRSH